MPGQWFNQLTVFNINAHVLGLGCGYNTITHNIGCGGVSSRCDHTHRVLNGIALNY